MAFELVKLSELPVREFGNRATEPRVGLGGNGRIVFNKLVSEAWKGVERLIIQYDSSARIVRFTPIFPAQKLPVGISEKDTFKIAVGKKDGGVSVGGSGTLTKIGYDFKSAGNQTFEAKLQAGKEGKGKAFDVVIPKETPKPRPVVARKKKAAAAGQLVNGAVAGTAVSVPVEAPAEEELVMVD